MTGKKSELPIKSKDVRKLTDEEYEKVAKGLLEDVELSDGKEVTWEDIERVARKVLTAKAKKPQPSYGKRRSC